jgi:acetyltransferase-like isoleucine patch superfamily enzyme
MIGMATVRQLYWVLLDELRTHQAHWVNSLPGRVGKRTRRRYYAARFKSCGSGFAAEENVSIQSPQNVRVGDNVRVGRDCYFSASGGLDIDSNSRIGAGTKIWTNNHVYGDPGTPFVEQGYAYKPVRIERDVWIGERCFIKPGTTIKKGAVIRPGTILAKSVPPNAIVQGNPGRIVGWRGKPPERSAATPAPPQER